MARNGVLGGGALCNFPLAPFTISLTVESHFKSLCIKVPKSLTWLTCCSSWSSMKISGGIGGFLENETFITQHLEGLRDMLLFEDHSVNDVTASCMRDGYNTSTIF